MSLNSTNKTNYSRSSSTRSRQNARVAAQTSIDAKLDAGFEEAERVFDYSTSIGHNISASTSNANDTPSSTVSAYLQRVQRGRSIQPFGCLIAVDEKSFKVLAYSKNAPEMLDLSPHAVPNIEQQEALTFGTDVRTLFKSSGATALEKATNHEDLNLLNPILVHCKTSGKPFYAILHRIDVGLVIDLEPVNPADVPVTAAGALKSYKLAAKSISRLQSLPSASISLLCDVVVKEVSELTGYDRVMVYKFHEDEHGEIVAECRRPHLEPYLGLHYPATDIPQASRFLIARNKVRMICDCLAPPVTVIQDKNLTQPLSLGGSTLRSPHGCHAKYMENMGSIASLVLAILINDEDAEVNNNDDNDNNQQKGQKLWGLVVCHHTSPQFVPFPLRYACEFLIQVFSVQINKEVELVAQMKEKHIFKTQSLLCDMLLRDSPIGIVTKSPNVKDLVKCDGAALYYKGKTWLLGITPNEAQIKDIIEWLLKHHGSSTGLSTDSLLEAGYPGASDLGDVVCGMAAVMITSKDFLFWFRSHTAKEVKWGGAKNDPSVRDDVKILHPRSSFKAFLEVVKHRSLAWEDVEMDAIHSLQLILRGSLNDEVVIAEENSKAIVNVVESVDDRKIQQMDELRVITNEIVHLIETAAVPILAVDSSGIVSGWNYKAAELTGLTVENAIGTPLVDLVDVDSVSIVKNMLSSALLGIEERNAEIKLRTFSLQENSGPVILVVNACCSRDTKGNIVGVCFVGQDITQQKSIADRYTRLQGDYTGIVRNPSALIPPIFMTDENGQCLEWNGAMEKLSSLRKEEAINRMLLGEVFTVNNFGCRVKNHDTLTKLRIMLNRVISDQQADKLSFGFYDQKGKYIEALLSMTKRIDAAGRVNGVLCFLHVASPELQYALKVQKIAEQAAVNSRNKLEYIRQEIRKTLNGLVLVENKMASSELSEEQKQLVNRNLSCREQLTKIVDDKDIESIEDCYMEMKYGKFNLGEVLEVVVTQVMIPSREKQVHIVCDFPSEVSSIHLYGDKLRIQQVLSDFLSNAVVFTSAFEGSSVTFKAILRQEQIGKNIYIVHVELRIIHPAPGIPEKLIHEMFYKNQSVSREGLGLYISQKIVKTMNGTVQYVRGTEQSSFIILLEFPLARQTGQ